MVRDIRDTLVEQQHQQQRCTFNRAIHRPRTSTSCSSSIAMGRATDSEPTRGTLMEYMPTMSSRFSSASLSSSSSSSSLTAMLSSELSITGARRPKPLPPDRSSFVRRLWRRGREPRVSPPSDESELSSSSSSPSNRARFDDNLTAPQQHT